MTLTIAARWRVTFRVQSLARVTMPVKAPTPARTKKGPDLLAIAAARRMRDEQEARQIHWQTDTLISARRMW